MNRYAQAHSVARHLDKAVEETVTEVRSKLQQTIDLAVVFVAGHPPDEFDNTLYKVKSLMGANSVVGCSCQTAIGGARELENESAVSIWAAEMPRSELVSFHLEYERTADGGAFVGWPEDLIGEWPTDSSLLLLGEPFSFPADILLAQLNEDRPGVPIFGGMSSGAFQPGASRLLLNDNVLRSGGVVVRISGTAILPIVSQGCRPIGEPFVVTASERNAIQQLGGIPALEQLQNVFRRLPTREQRLVQAGLHVGLVIDEYQERFAFGDFLIRNVVGVDADSGTITIGDYVRPGQTIQFHVRDADSASAELTQMLNRAATKKIKSALLFTCNGRGLNLFSEPDHDAQAVRNELGEIPTAGFFAAGEIGPVTNQNFLHGFTASIALFE